MSLMDIESAPTSSSRNNERTAGTASSSSSSSSCNDDHKRGTSYGATLVRSWSSLGYELEFTDAVASYRAEQGRDDTDAKIISQQSTWEWFNEQRIYYSYAAREYTSYIFPELLWDSRPPIRRIRIGDEDGETSKMTNFYRGLMVVGLCAVLAVGYVGQTGWGNVPSPSTSSTYSTTLGDNLDADAVAITTTAIIEPMKGIGLKDVQVIQAEITQLSSTGIPISLPVVRNIQPLLDGLYAIVTNEYSDTGTKMFPYPFLTDAILMEPYRDSTVTMQGFSSGCNLEYTLTGVTNPSIVLSERFEQSEDGVFQIHPTKTGQYILHIEQTCDEDRSKDQVFEQSVWVKYVRRELLSLTDEDREEFLDAFRTLWEVTTRDGMDIYGKLFKSLHYLATVHNDGSGNPICDEFDMGAGFLNNHIYLSLYAEQSLRLINPRVSLHYMDYSKYFESPEFKHRHIANQLDGGNWTEIFSAKWFGKNDPLTGVIVDSRWAYSKTPFVTSEFLNSEMIPDKATFYPLEERSWLLQTENNPHITSPYGLLRSPWNYNPSPYTTRYNNVNRLPKLDVPEYLQKPLLGSTCADMKSFFSNFAIDEPLYIYLEAMQDNIYENVPYTIGGTGGDRAATIDAILRDKYSLSDTHMFYIAEASHVFAKAYLTGGSAPGQIENPLVCVGKPWVNGKLTTSAHPGDVGGPDCQCQPDYLVSEEKIDVLIGLYFKSMPADDTITDLDFDTKKEIMTLVCQRMSYEGDMSGSGAALDPLFWVVPGAVDRLYQRVVFENVLSDHVYKTSKKSVGCSGHETSGAKKWLKGYFMEDPTIDFSQLTNLQLAEVLDPSTDVFRDLQNTVYADSQYPWCNGFESYLNPSLDLDESGSEEGGHESLLDTITAAATNVGNEVMNSLSNLYSYSRSFFTTTSSSSSSS